MQAAELFAQQVKPPEAARQLRVSVKSAYHACLEKLAGYLEQGPAAHGWTEDQVWTAAGVATLIGRKFHVSYSVSGATRLMRRSLRRCPHAGWPSATKRP